MDLGANIERRGPDECWPWKRAKTIGYGCVRLDGRTQYVHRLIYEQTYGPIPDGLVVDHTCHNADPTCREGNSCPHRACQNPAHMQLTTRGKNRANAPIAGMAAVHAAKTHCVNGHPLVGDNLKPGKGRICRTCARARAAAYSRKKRDKVG